MKNIKIYLPIVVMLIAFATVSGCSRGQEKSSEKKVLEDSRDIFAMDTYMTLKAYGENCSEALDAAVEEIERLDYMFSTGNKESEVSILNENGSEILSKESAYLFQTSQEIYIKTKGAFDITIYPLMQEWGFTNQKYQVPEKEALEKLLRNIGTSKIEYDSESRFISLPEGMQIDFGGIAKGYTSQRIVEIFKKYNLTGGIVSLGGNVQTYGTKPENSEFKVGIEDPFGGAEYVGILQVKNKSVITSGGYERFFEQNGVTYHHILNPKTGYPAESGLKSVTIVNEDGTKADALSTALFVLGKEKAVEFWKTYGRKEGFDIILVEDSGAISISKGLEGIFTSDNKFQVIK